MARPGAPTREQWREIDLKQAGMESVLYRRRTEQCVAFCERSLRESTLQLLQECRLNSMHFPQAHVADGRWAVVLYGTCPAKYISLLQVRFKALLQHAWNIVGASS